MLATKHYAVRVMPRHALARRAGLQGFLTLLRAAQRADGADSGFSDMEFFAERYGDLRDELAIRAMKGERLSPQEDAMLRALDAVLADVEPPQPGLAEEVHELVQQVLRTYGA